MIISFPAVAAAPAAGSCGSSQRGTGFGSFLSRSGALYFKNVLKHNFCGLIYELLVGSPVTCGEDTCGGGHKRSVVKGALHVPQAERVAGGGRVGQRERVQRGPTAFALPNRSACPVRPPANSLVARRVSTGSGAVTGSSWRRGLRRSGAVRGDGVARRNGRAGDGTLPARGSRAQYERSAIARTLTIPWARDDHRNTALCCIISVCS